MCTTPSSVVLIINLLFLCWSGVQHCVLFSMDLGPAVLSGMLSTLEVAVSSLALDTPDLSSPFLTHCPIPQPAPCPRFPARFLLPKAGRG